MDTLTKSPAEMTGIERAEVRRAAASLADFDREANLIEVEVLRRQSLRGIGNRAAANGG